MEDNWKDLKESLLQIKFSLEQMLIQLKRIAEQCDPYLFYNRVRVYLSGWKGNPDFPNGVIFEGITNNSKKRIRYIYPFQFFMLLFLLLKKYRKIILSWSFCCTKYSLSFI